MESVSPRPLKLHSNGMILNRLLQASGLAGHNLQGLAHSYIQKRGVEDPNFMRHFPKPCRVLGV